MRSDDADFTDPPAERGVLSAILLDERQARGTYALAAQYIRVTAERRDDGGVAIDGDFGDPRNNLIFAAMGELSRRGEAIDAQTVGAELRMMGRWNAVGAQYLGDVIDEVITTSSVEAHARIVRREADRRRVDLALARARRTLRASRDPDAALAATLDVVRGGIEGGSVRGGPRPLADYIEANWKELEDRARGVAPQPLTLGLGALDRATGGAFPGQVVVVAGVQGRGKTAWLAQMLKANARRFVAEAAAERAAGDGNARPKRVAWWSLEMPGSELVWRHGGWDAGIPQAVLRSGKLNQDEMNSLADSFNAMHALPVDLDGESAVNVLDIRAWLYAHPDTKLAAVDWLGCLQPHPNAPKGAKAHEHAAMNMEVLAATARQLGITIVVPNQFTQEANRGASQSMHDMLGGAAVVNFASIIAVMRPGDAMEGDDLPVSIRVEKSRLSGNALVEAVFCRRTGEFVEREEYEHRHGITRDYDNVAQLPPAKAGRRGPRKGSPAERPAWTPGYGNDADATGTEGE